LTRAWQENLCYTSGFRNCRKVLVPQHVGSYDQQQEDALDPEKDNIVWL